METIEATIRGHSNSGGSSNDSTDSGKRRRESANIANAGCEEDGDFAAESTARSKKKAPKKHRKQNEPIDYADLGYLDEFMEADLEENSDPQINGGNGGRVLPSWLAPGS